MSDNNRIDLDILRGRRGRLTRDEYLDALYELRDESLIKALEYQRSNKETRVMRSLQVVDKAHWLIDSTEGKADATQSTGSYMILFADSPEDSVSVSA